MIHLIEESILINILEEDPLEIKQRLKIIVNGNRSEIINKKNSFKENLLEGILDNEINIYPRRYPESKLLYFLISLNPFFFVRILSSNYSYETFKNFFEYYLHSFEDDKFKANKDIENENPVDKKIETLIEIIDPILNIKLIEWQRDISNWDFFVESVRNTFGDSWSTFMIGVVAAGVKTSEVEDIDNLHDDKVSLCKRLRSSRMKSGNIKFWEKSLEHKDLEKTLVMLFVWATPKTIYALENLISKKVESISFDSFREISKHITTVSEISKFSQVQRDYIEEKLMKSAISNKVKYLISFRYDNASRRRIINSYIEDFDYRIQEITKTKLEYLTQFYLTHPGDSIKLTEIREKYSKIRDFNGSEYYYHQPTVKIPLEQAKQIMKYCKQYPLMISNLAEKSCRIAFDENVIPVGKIAEEKKWFI